MIKSRFAAVKKFPTEGKNPKPSQSPQTTTENTQLHLHKIFSKLFSHLPA